MAAGQWNTRIDRGAVWRRTLRYADSAGTPIAVAAPAFMDVRAKPDEDAVLLTRLDSTGTAPGDITFGEPGALTLELTDDVTATLAPGQYYYDLFVTGSDGQLLKLVRGVITVAGNVSVVL